MIYWTSFCILFPYLDFGLERHPVVSVSDENSVDMAICKVLQEIFAKFPKYASVTLKYFNKDMAMKEMEDPKWQLQIRQ